MILSCVGAGEEGEGGLGPPTESCVEGENGGGVGRRARGVMRVGWSAPSWATVGRGKLLWKAFFVNSNISVRLAPSPA